MASTKKTKKTVETVTEKKLPLRKRGDKWQVDFRKIGKGQMTYDTKSEAKGHAEATYNQWMTEQLTGIDLSPARRKIALDAFAELREYGDDALMDAVRLYKETYNGEIQKKTVWEVTEEYLEAKAGAGLAEKTLKGYEDYMSYIRKGFGERLIAEVQANEIQKYINKQKWKVTHRRNVRRHFSMLFKFAVGRKYAQYNPVADGVANIKKSKAKPAILTPHEFRNLLIEAREYSGGIMLPYFAICGLAGIRPEETRRLPWEHINLKEKNIYVGDAKLDEDRDVEICDALAEWLELTPEENRTGKIFWTKAHFDNIRKRAGVWDRWQEPKGRDILRHSAASHHARLCGDMHKTALQMGHDVMTLRSYYKAKVTKDEAKEYFNIRPKNAKRKTVIELKRKTA